MLALNAAADTAVVQMVTAAALVGPKRSVAPVEYGYIADGGSVPQEYLVWIIFRLVR